MAQEFKQTGTMAVSDDLTLKDFTWKVVKAWHDLEVDQSFVEVHAWEVHKVHSRVFQIVTPSPWTAENVFLEVMKLTPFLGSTIVT